MAIQVLSYKKIEDYTKDLDRSKTMDEIEDVETDRFGFIIHEANENIQSKTKETNLALDVLRKRELKWLSMIAKWDKYFSDSKRKEKIKERCRKGIPSAVRGVVWQHLTGSIRLKEKDPTLYENLAKQDSPEWEGIIKKDIPRTFPYHELFFQDCGPGQMKLLRVLRAFSLYDSDIGYSQALSPIVAVLIMHMPEEEAFWLLVSISKKFLPGYFGRKLESIQLDSLIFSSLLDSTYPYISNHMKKHNIDPVMYIVEWMMCLFSRTLPFSTAMRVWDIFFCEGIKMVYRAALTILKIAFPTEKSLAAYHDDYETIQGITNIERTNLNETFFIPLALSIKLTRNDLKKHRAKALAKRPDLAVIKS